MESLNISSVDISSLYLLACEKLLSKDNNTDSEEDVSCVNVLGGGLPSSAQLDLFFVTGFASKVILSILYALAFTVAVIGNILVVVTFALNPRMRSTTNSFIVSLAVSDFLMAITCMPINLGSVHTTHWVFGPFACKLVPYVMTLAVACSSLTLCCIAFDRYKAIVHPLKLRFYVTSDHVTGMLIVVWILAALSAVPNAVFYHIKTLEVNYSTVDMGISTFPICAYLGSHTQEVVFLWYQLGFLFMAPFLIMVIFYGIIAYRLWIRKPVGTRVLYFDNKNTRIKQKVIKMLVVIVTLFVVCWMPLLVFDILVRKMKPSETLWTLRHYLQLLAMMSTCCNPVVYSIMNESFKKKFANVLLCRRNRVGVISVRPCKCDVPNVTRMTVRTFDGVREGEASTCSSRF